MKKRIVAAALILCLCVLFSLPLASATNDLFFVAVNDTIPLTLSGDEKPYASATGLYVPYTVFNAAPGGVVAGYNANTQTLVLFSSQKSMTFNIGKGTYTDETDKVSDVLTTYKNGRLYIPLNLTTSHFGLSYSILTSKGGYTVLRFTNGRQVYDDAQFLEKAETLIAYRVESIGNGQETDAGQTDANEPETDEKTPICFLITDASQMEAAMEELKRQGSSAAFFFTAEELEAYPDLVRKLYVQGHVLGLTVPDGETSPQTALREANELLDGLLHEKSLLVLVSAEQKTKISGWFSYEKPASAQSVTTTVRYKTDTVYVSTQNAVQEIRAAVAAGAELSLLRENTKSK